MIGELDLNGILLSPALASGVVAFVLFVLVQRVMVRLRVHRLVWHAALFDAAVYVVLWAGVSALPIPVWS